MLESWSKAEKTESSLVSKENFSEILWPSGWALGQVTTWAKMANYFTYDVTHKKSTPPTKTLIDFLAFLVQKLWPK